MQGDITDLEIFGLKMVAYFIHYARHFSYMPRLICSNMDQDRTDLQLFSQKGRTLSVRVPGKKRIAQEITPSMQFPNAGTEAEEFENLTLDQLFGDHFGVAEPQKMQIEDFESLDEEKMNEVADAVVTKIDDDIFNEIYLNTYLHIGDVSTKPFESNTDIASDLGAMLTEQRMHDSNRHLVIDPFSYAHAAKTTPFADASASGGSDIIMTGLIRREMLGFNWWRRNQLPIHIAGVPGGSLTVAGAFSVDSKTVDIDNTGTGALKRGDLITFDNGSPISSVVLKDVTWAIAGVQSVSINPLQTALSGSEDISLMPDHKVGLAFHKSVAVFCSRLLRKKPNIQHIFDLGVSGVGLNVVQNNGFLIDDTFLMALYGVKTIARERAIRIIMPVV